MRHALPLFAIALTSVSMFGCQGGSPTAPVDSATAISEAGIGQTLVSDAAKLGALGLYDVSLDPNSLSATVTLRETRHAQENDDVYLLGIDGFLRPDSFQILSIERPSTGSLGPATPPRLELNWQFTHPFASSGSIPRADLGFSGIACFLFDVDTAVGHSYFTADANVILNESLVQLPDGFFQPRALLDLTGYTANAFPYQSLVEELEGIGTGNRRNSATGSLISNGDDPHGNFGPLGWQTGTTETWTGYDILHQGQSVRRTLNLDLASIAVAGTVDFTVAIFDKYVDPKSATPGFEHRLPADPPDVLGDFGYRYPHGCWDVSHVRYIGETQGLIAGKPSETDVRFFIRDWDARAAATTETQLSDEADPSKVLPSSIGAPALRASVPAAFGGPDVVIDFGANPTDDDTIRGGGDLTPDSGQPLDELYYLQTLTAPAGVSTPGGAPIWGVIEVLDVENPLPAYQAVLDSNLQPLSTDLPRNATYQVFQLDVQTASAAPGFAASGHGPEISFATSVVYDQYGSSFVGGQFQNSISLGGTTYTSNGSYDCFVACYDPDGAFLWANTWGGTGEDTVEALLLSEDAAFSLRVAGSFRGTVNFDPPAGSPRTAQQSDAYVMTLQSTNGAFTSVRTFGSPGLDVINCLADNGNRATGDYFIGGYFMGPIDFGNGHTLTPNAPLEGFVVGLDDLMHNALSSYALWSSDLGYSTVEHLDLFEDGTVAAGGVFAVELNGPDGPVGCEGDTDGFLMRIAMNTAPGGSGLTYLDRAGSEDNDHIGGLLAFGTGATASMMAAINSDDGTDDRAQLAHRYIGGGTPLGFDLMGGDGAFQINGITRAPGSTLADGRYYITGYKSNTLLFYSGLGAAPILLPPSSDSGDSQDMFVVCYSNPLPGESFFQLNWARQFGAEGAEIANAIAAAPTGIDAIAMAGSYGSEFDFAPGPNSATLPVVAPAEAFITQLPADGGW